jgi:hypothetical protein
LVRELHRTWRLALRNENTGQWSQIQKRVYRLAGLTKARFLRRRAAKDLLENPTLAERISDYMRCSGSVTDYLAFVDGVLRHKEQIHDDVALVFIESLLRVEATGGNARLILARAKAAMSDISQRKRTELFAAPASLLILRFGDRRQISGLRRCFQESRTIMPPQAIRSAAIVYASYGRKEFYQVRRAAAVLLSNPLASMVRLVLRISRFVEVPDRYKARLIVRRDSVSGRQYLDMRMLLAARLLALNNRKTVRLWLDSWVRGVKKQRVSPFDKRLLDRMLP